MGVLMFQISKRKSVYLVTAIALVAFTDNALAASKRAEIVVDANTGNVIHEMNATELRHPASITKVMTLYLLFDAIKNGKTSLDDKVYFSKKAASQAPSKLGIKPGNSVPVETAILSIVTRSANDTAVAIAEKLGGTEANFASMMTQKAHELGMSRTTFVNASGLPNASQITTAEDLAKLAIAIRRDFPNQYHWFNTQSFVYNGQVIKNHNHLVGKVYGVDGLKTGFTGSSGYNLAATSSRNGQKLVTVVMGGTTWKERDDRVENLIETTYASLNSSTGFASNSNNDNNKKPGGFFNFGSKNKVAAIPTNTSITSAGSSILLADTATTKHIKDNSSSYMPVKVINADEDSEDVVVPVSSKTFALNDKSASSNYVAPVRVATYSANSASFAKPMVVEVMPVPAPVTVKTVETAYVPVTTKTAKMPIKTIDNEKTMAALDLSPEVPDSMVKEASVASNNISTFYTPEVKSENKNLGSESIKDVKVAVLERNSEANSTTKSAENGSVKLASTNSQSTERAVANAIESAEKSAAQKEAQNKKIQAANLKKQQLAELQKRQAETKLAAAKAAKDKAAREKALENEQSRQLALSNQRGNVTVQLGAFNKKSDAENTLNKLSVHFPSFASKQVSAYTNGNTTWFRARVGNLGMSAASDLCNSVRTRGFVCAIVR